MTLPHREIHFAGHRFVLDGRGALYWPAQQALVVSDMHLEKSTFLARHGSFIAPYDTLDTLERLEALIAHYTPRELVLLGDSFHDRHAWERLDEPLRERIRNLDALVERCHWIEGNHDSALLERTLPNMRTAYSVDGVLFTHDHDSTTALAQVMGHYHPKASLMLGNRTLRSACFVVSPTLLVMPAFGSYTGGLDIKHDAFRGLLNGAPAQVYLLYRNAVYSI